MRSSAARRLVRLEARGMSRSGPACADFSAVSDEDLGRVLEHVSDITEAMLLDGVTLTEDQERRVGEANAMMVAAGAVFTKRLGGRRGAQR